MQVYIPVRACTTTPLCDGLPGRCNDCGVTRFEIDPESSEVRIDGSSSVHPIRASAKGLSGWVELDTSRAGLADDTRVAGEVRIEVDRLRSGNSLVDRETRRRIDARRYPEIVGTVTTSETTGPGRLALTGVIAFRGEECEVSGEVGVSIEGDMIVIEGSQDFDVRDWGLQPPKLALLRVHPVVEVRIRVVATATGRRGADR